MEQLGEALAGVASVGNNALVLSACVLELVLLYALPSEPGDSDLSPHEEQKVLRRLRGFSTRLRKRKRD